MARGEIPPAIAVERSVVKLLFHDLLEGGLDGFEQGQLLAVGFFLALINGLAFVDGEVQIQCEIMIVHVG